MTDDEPDPKVVVATAFSAASHTYDDVIEFFGPFGRALVEAAPLRPGDRVLDVAGGRGATLFPALDVVGTSGWVTGVDLAPGMVEVLRNELSARVVPNAEVLVGDAEDLDLPDASFDAVLGGFMIFFPPDPPKALRELHRVLRPGGSVALSIFDSDPGFGWLREVAKELFGDVPGRPNEEFNKAAVLDAALVEVGFEPPTGTEVSERFHFVSVEQVEAWQRSHGGRLMLDALDDARLARYRELVRHHLDARHRVDGGYELAQSARMTVARKPH